MLGILHVFILSFNLLISTSTKWICIWVMKHLPFVIQTPLKELSLYCPPQLTCKCKLSSVKGGGRGTEKEEANSGPSCIALGEQWGSLQEDEERKAIISVKIRASGMSNIRKRERGTEGRWEGIWENPCFTSSPGTCDGIRKSLFSSSSSFWFQIKYVLFA